MGWPRALANWHAAFIGILIHPGTGEAARSILIARALEFLQRDPRDLAQREPAFRRPELVGALDHLLATGGLRDEEGESFLNLKIRPELTLASVRAASGALIPVHLSLGWVVKNFGSIQMRNLPAPWSALGPATTTYPLIRVDVVFVTGDAEVVSTHEPMRFESAFDWYVYEAAAIRESVARGERSEPEPSFRTRGLGADAALIRAPAAAGRYHVVFDVRLTALRPDPANPGAWLEPDGSAVEVARRFELEFEVHADEAEPAADPLR